MVGETLTSAVAVSDYKSVKKVKSQTLYITGNDSITATVRCTIVRVMKLAAVVQQLKSPSLVLTKKCLLSLLAEWYLDTENTYFPKHIRRFTCPSFMLFTDSVTGSQNMTEHEMFPRDHASFYRIISTISQTFKDRSSSMKVINAVVIVKLSTVLIQECIINEKWLEYTSIPTIILHVTTNLKILRQYESVEAGHLKYLTTAEDCNNL